jgi:HlyD family secretion protein
MTFVLPRPHLPHQDPQTVRRLPKPASAATSWRLFAASGYAIIVATFGVAGGWASVTKIDSAVDAQAVVAVETNRKTVEHLEGGIVRAILVKEGAHVEAGDTLFRLDDVAARANYDAVNAQYLAALAAEARLVAERDSASAIAWPRELLDKAGASKVDRVMADQNSDFLKRRQSLQAQLAVVGSRIEQLGIARDGSDAQRIATEKQIFYIDKELVGLHQLADKNLIPVTRLYSMERERERLEGVIGEARTEAAKSQEQIGEFNSQIEQLKQKFQEDVATSLVETRQRISDLGEKRAIALDVFSRLDIEAPVSGTAQNLKVFTVGQVLRPGEPLLDIVPEDEPLIVEAQIAPTDIDGVYVGQPAEIRFPALHSRTIPLMLGRLESVSKDRIVDDTTKQSFYRGIVSLDKAKIPAEWRSRIRAGMPSEVIVSSGERTVLNYLVSPLANMVRKSFIN